MSSKVADQAAGTSPARFRYWLTAFTVGGWRLVCSLPLSWLRIIGMGLGETLHTCLPTRRAVALRNVSVCFPEHTAEWHRRTVRQHFRRLGCAIFYLGVVCWSSPRRVDRLVHVSGSAHINKLVEDGQGVILLAPHFVDALFSGLYLASRYPLTTMYKKPRNPVFHALYRRTATGQTSGDRLLDWIGGKPTHRDMRLVEHRDGLRAIIRDFRSGRMFYYLPDQDLGRRQTVFAPFFSVPAVSNIAIGKFARLGRAKIVPLFAFYDPATRRINIELTAPLASIPADDPVKEAVAANQAIESLVRRHPDHYFWLHKRFKTRPEGEGDFYRRMTIANH